MKKNRENLLRALFCVASAMVFASGCSTGGGDSDPGGSVSVNETDAPGGDGGVSEESNAGGAVDLGPEGDVAVDCLVEAGLAPESYTAEQLGTDMMSPPEDASVDVESTVFTDCLAEAGLEHQSGGDGGSVGG